MVEGVQTLSWMMTLVLRDAMSCRPGMRWLAGVIAAVLVSSVLASPLNADLVNPAEVRAQAAVRVVESDHEPPATADNPDLDPEGLVVTKVDDHTIELYIAD